jgi:hypothetical protein
MQVLFSPIDFNAGAAEEFAKKKSGENGTACAVRFRWDFRDRGWRAQRTPTPATAIGPPRGRRSASRTRLSLRDSRAAEAATALPR